MLAKEHNIPFYVAVPSSTFDFSIKNGGGIPIEERYSDEVRKIGTVYTAPKDIKVYNPAFDVTPNNLITAIITDKGILKQPFKKSLGRLCP